MNHRARDWPWDEDRWISLRGSEHETNLYLRFVREFTCEGRDPLDLWMTAVSRYRLWLNGIPVARGPAPASASRRYFHRYRVGAAALRPGCNTLAVLLHHDGAMAATRQKIVYGVPGLLVHAECGGVSFGSDGRWLVRRDPARTGTSAASPWGGFKEYYHGEREVGWLDGGTRTGGWMGAEEEGPPLDERYARRLVELDVHELEHRVVRPRAIVSRESWRSGMSAGGFRPVTFSGAGGSASVTYDFGREVVGYPTITTDGGPHAYEVWYGETPDLRRLDFVTFAVGGTWEAQQRRAFRYLRVRMLRVDGPVAVREVATTEHRYPYHRSGRARSGRRDLDAILATSRRTLRACTSYHFEDGPARESALWVLDLRIMALHNYYAFGNPELVAKCLRQLLALQLPDGSVPSMGPLENGCRHLDYCLLLVTILKEYFQYSGDRGLVEEAWDSLVVLDAFIARYATESGLLDLGRGPWSRVHLDWAPGLCRSGRPTMLSALYARHLDDFAFLARTLGRPDGHLVTRHRRLEDAFHRTFYDPAGGAYRDALDPEGHPVRPTFQAGMAALAAGLAPRDLVPQIIERLADVDRFPPSCSPAFYATVFEALDRHGRHDLLLSHLGRFWGGMLSRGAKTWWEVFDPQSHPGSYPHPLLGNMPDPEADELPPSSCHGWSVVPGYAVPRHVLGIDLGFLHAGQVHIRRAGATWFERFSYRVPCRGSFLQLEFRRRRGRCFVDVIENPRGVAVVIDDPL